MDSDTSNRYQVDPEVDLLERMKGGPTSPQWQGVSIGEIRRELDYLCGRDYVSAALWLQEQLALKEKQSRAAVRRRRAKRQEREQKIQDMANYGPSMKVTRIGTGPLDTADAAAEEGAADAARDLGDDAHEASRKFRFNT